MTLLQDAENFSLPELFQHQQTAWERQCRYVVQNSKFYQKLWDGLTPPEDLRDLPKLPFSSKSELRDSQADTPPFGNYLASDRSTANRLHRTSGTTGQAMNLALSARDCEITEIVGGRSHRAAGLTPEHTVVHCLNYQMWMGGLTDHLTLERTGALVVPFGVGGTELLIRTILETGINAISCTPSYPVVLEKVLEERFPELTPRDLGLELGLFGGEAGLDDPAFRERIQETWGLSPRNANYGVSDVLSNFAAQCEHDMHLHFLAGDVLYPELVNPDTGQSLPLETGQEGELVLTHLERDCQPLVRFKTGDIISIQDTTPCRCGRKGMRFKVVGRNDDMVVVRGLNLFPTMVAAAINEFEELSGDYRIILETRPPYDVLPVQVELAKNKVVSDDFSEKVEQKIKSNLGASALVTVLKANSFPTTEGKTKRVIRSYK